MPVSVAGRRSRKHVVDRFGRTNRTWGTFRFPRFECAKTGVTETPAPGVNHRADSGHPAVEAPPLAPDGAPLCYVVDEEPSIRHFLSLVLHGAGVDTVRLA